MQDLGSGMMRRTRPSDEEPEMALICGHFRASYGTSIDLLATVSSAIVERFDAADKLDGTLKSALAEFADEKVGMGAMTAVLMKQVLLTLLRRSLTSFDLWAERFSALSDRSIARAFAAMAARPGAPHAVDILAREVGLSCSVFMARFTSAFGEPPMAVLRQLRMRRAAALLAASSLSIDQVSGEVGYVSRSSFLRLHEGVRDRSLEVSGRGATCAPPKARTRPVVRWRCSGSMTRSNLRWIVEPFANDPDAAQITLVQDNLSTHTAASLYAAFPAVEARRLVRRFEWHYTPKHGSWLDMAESELGVLSSQCLSRRIPDKQTLQREVAAWQDHRNKHHAKADWQFTTDDARVKLKRLYPTF